MTQTFIPGYFGTITINSEDLSAVGSVYRLNLGRNVNVKKHFGGPHSDRVVGKRDVTLSANGNLTKEEAAALNAIYESEVAVAFTLQIGEAAGATDAGVYAGNLVISSLTLEANADGDVAWSLDGGAHGQVTYTPAA